jgi:hypothetical protein
LDYNLRNIRTLLTECFTDEELRQLCFDHPAFQPFKSHLPEPASPAQLARLIVDYARRKSLLETLLAWAKELNPNCYKIHEPYHTEPYHKLKLKQFVSTKYLYWLFFFCPIILPVVLSFYLWSYPYLFSIRPDFIAELDTGQVSTRLYDQFKVNGQVLTSQAQAVVEQAGSQWTIVDDGKTYLIQRENQTLNAYQLESPPYTVWEIVFWLKFSSFILLFWALLNFLGLIGGHPPDIKSTPDTGWSWDKQVLLIVSYVSKGVNQNALKRSLSATKKELDSMNVWYEIEIVTDIEVPEENRIPATNGSIHYLEVPKDYKENTELKYKARALQYRLEQRTDRLNRDKIDWQNSGVWVLHLDEESVITSQAIIGIKDFIRNYIKESKRAIGQGEILYNSYNYGNNILITAMDSLRTGDDLGRFRFQYKFWHKPVAGMHGSYVLMPAVIENEIGWDWGSKSILAEDTYFAFKAMEKNIEFDWVDGFIKEQSPFSIGDIIRQRMRWYTGLSLIATDRSLKLRTTIILIIFIISWTVAWISSVVFITNLIVTLLTNKGFFPFWAVMITSCITGAIGSIYMIGVLRNLTHLDLDPPLSRWRKLYIALATYVLLVFQISPLVEAVAVIYSIYRAIFRPLKEFPIVAKD